MSASIRDTIDAMRSAGLDAEAILKTVEALLDREEARAEERRAADAARKRAKRSGHGDVSAESGGHHGHPRNPADAPDPSSPHTPLQPTQVLSPKKTPKGVQKGPLADKPELEARFRAVFDRLPPQARRKGEEVCRFAYRRAVASGADPGEIDAAAEPWMQESGSVIERFDRWLDEGLWRQWVPKARQQLAPPETPDQWRRRVRQFHDHAAWHAPGPPPDDPACQAPPEVLAEFGYRERAA